MIWFSWRQVRTSAMVLGGLLLVVLVVVVLTGPHMVHLYDTTVKACRAKSDCLTAQGNLLSKYNKPYQLLLLFGLLLPVVIGIFLGAPLVAREFETGTFRLAWTQGVTRSRWFVTKFVVVGLVCAAVSGLYSLLVTWWASPIETINLNRFTSVVYESNYLAPIGYTIFAFAVGVTAGVVWRRTLPAMATTLVVFIASRLLFVNYVRSHLVSPVRAVVSISRGSSFGFEKTPTGLEFAAKAGNPPNAWTTKSGLIGLHGAQMSSQWLKTNCVNLVKSVSDIGPKGGSPAARPAPQAFQNCVNKITLHFRFIVDYQPANRFWTFQILETSIFIVVAFLLCALSYWWLRRRTA
jgi:ABC-type transport system involved in multi-copper enzyme maturation permease subunit